ncbi:hypothetical protein GQF03_14060 [Sneathiella chungangensis]|uniref:Uncharacterized protein n=1 Tax=Sneathiella chungangensis TaxID=1418234 RepID=A0A845MHL4_9PROT|nr:hypothetical protein [Sneathiella chungangensis]MZR23458.1 hypothetical protein [Sneathiella chungangensis]
MQKISYFLLGAILLSGFTFGQAEARQDGKYTFDSKKSYQRFDDRSDRGHRDGKDYRNSKDHRNGKDYRNSKNYRGNKAHGKSSNVGRNVTYGRQSEKPRNLYKAPPPKYKARAYYAKPHHKHYFKYPYRPKYVYIKPYYAPRYWGYYPYRGHYWPFVNVNFVFDLTARQVEYHHQAVYAALDAPVGEVVRWRDGARRGTIVILRDGYDEYGNLCKEYRQTVTYRGRTMNSVEVSCLSPEGYWISV